MGARFQVLFHSPPGVLFTFPSRYWCAIGHRVVLRLGWWSTQVRTGFHVPGPTQGTASRRPVWVRVRGCHPLRPALPCRSAPQPDLRPGRQPRMRGPATPSAEPLPGTPARRFGHRSPFARRYSGSLEIDFLSSGYLDVSVPRVVLPAPMCSGSGYPHCCGWVRPFGDPRVEGCVLLAGDYRSLPRPSSAPCAKASAVRPWYLAGPHRARGISTCRQIKLIDIMNSARMSQFGYLIPRHSVCTVLAIRCSSLIYK